MFSFLKNKIKLSATGITSIILSVLLVISIILGCGVYFGDWFKDSSISIGDSVIDAEEDYDLADSVVIDTSNSSGKLSLTSARTLTASSSSTPVYAEDSYTLTAVYNTDASDPSFKWSSSNTSNISIAASDDTISCVVTFKSAFSSQITITCTAVDDSSVTASCTVDYIKRATDCSLTMVTTELDFMTWQTSGTSLIWAIPDDDWNDDVDVSDNVYVNNYFKYSSSSVTTGTGSLSESYDISSVEISTTSLYNSGYAYTNLSSTVYSDTLSSSSVSNYYYSYYLRSMYHNSSTNLNWLKYETYRNQTYSYMQEAYDDGVGMDVQLTIVGSITGLTYTFSYNMNVNPSALYQAVTSVSLEESAICF